MPSSAGVPKYLQGGTDTVRVSVPVAKGQGTEYDPDKPGQVRPWGAGSTTRAGVAATAGVPPESNASNLMTPVRPDIAVYKAPKVVRMRFAGAAVKGDPLVAAANGQVVKDTSATVLTLVGYCQGGDDGATVTSGGWGHVELT
jgi:hypothetical protein